MCEFAILIQILALTVLYQNNICTLSRLLQPYESVSLAYKMCWYRNRKRLIPARSLQANVDFLNVISALKGTSLRFNFTVPQLVLGRVATVKHLSVQHLLFFVLDHCLSIPWTFFDMHQSLN